MKKLLLSTICSAFALSPVVAQEGAPEGPQEKKFDHIVGFQVNGLLRQVFNFGNPPAVNNPYLAVYTLSLRNSGWGLRVGGGYNSSYHADNDGITETESNLKNWDVRFGVEKSFRLSDKWIAGAGLDGLYGDNYNRTRNVIHGFDSSTSDIRATVVYYGGGAMAWLRYHITDNILVGTEASFYMRFGEEERRTTITQLGVSGPFPVPQVTTTTTRQEHKLNEGLLSLPVAFYLIVKF